jgi:hypothetical protein
MENGGWRMEDGEWRIENRDWRLEFGIADWWESKYNDQ